MKRLLQVSPFHPDEEAMGGPIQLVRQIARAQAFQRIRPIGILCPSLPGRQCTNHWNTIECETVMKYRTVSVTKTAPLRQAIEHCDMVLVHGYRHWLPVQAAWECQRAQKPYVLHLHGMANRKFRSRGKKQLFDSLIGRKMVSRARGVIFSSKVEIDNAKECVTALPRWAIIPNALEDVEVFDHASERRKWVTRLGLKPELPLVLSLGRVSPSKNYEAILELGSETRPVSLVIAGPEEDAAYAARLRGMARGRRWGSVAFCGAVYGAEKQSVLAAADVFITTSMLDSFNLAAAEALYQGTPVILPKWLGIVEHLDGLPCFRLESLAPEAMRAGLEQALSSERPVPGFPRLLVEAVLPRIEETLLGFCA